MTLLDFAIGYLAGIVTVLGTVACMRDFAGGEP